MFLGFFEEKSHAENPANNEDVRVILSVENSQTMINKAQTPRFGTTSVGFSYGKLRPIIETAKGNGVFIEFKQNHSYIPRDFRLVKLKRGTRTRHIETRHAVSVQNERTNNVLPSGLVRHVMPSTGVYPGRHSGED